MSSKFEVEKIVRDALNKELAKLIEVEIDNLNMQIRQQLRERITQVTLAVSNHIQFMNNTNQLVITICQPEVKNEKEIG